MTDNHFISIRYFMKKYPVLIIIPHGGYSIPYELIEVTDITDFDLYIQGDTCANELFAFDKFVAAKLDSQISRLFVDMDRNKKKVGEKIPDGIIKTATLNGKSIFIKDTYPDNIAINNIIRRYYRPFHDAIEKLIKTGDIKFILECHTMMSVGPRFASDAGDPRPIVMLENNIEKDGDIINSCDDLATISLLDNIKKQFSDEKHTVTEPVVLAKYPSQGHLMNSFLNRDIPYIRLSLSKSLFLNDEYFSYEYLRVDEIRMKQLKEKLWRALDKFFKKLFG